jgi:hypothetical protein
MDVKVYVASTGKGAYALAPENVIEVCVSGPYPLSDAKSYAFDYTKGEDKPAYVYEVSLREVGSYQTRKEVVFVPPKP